MAGVFALMGASVSPVLAQCELATTEVTGADMQQGYKLGFAVAVSGNVAVLGAPGHNSRGGNTGAAYVFRRESGRWVQQARLLASDGVGGDLFGAAVSVSGNVIAVGAYGHDVPVLGAGAVYVFRYNGVSWREEQKLIATDAGSADAFGRTVAVYGDVVVGGSREHSAFAYKAGAAYVFRFNGSSWTLDEKLRASDASAGDRFATSVAATNGRIIVGADSDDDRGTNAGSAYVFRDDGTRWVQEGKLLASDGAGLDLFGTSVAIDDRWAVVGAHTDDDAGESSGAAYVYYFDGVRWVQDQKLRSSELSSYDYFGYSVAISGGLILVGAYWDDPHGASGIYDSGAAYRFRFDGNGWVEEAEIAADNGRANDWLGYAVALDGETAVAGVVQDDGAAYDAGKAMLLEGPCQSSGGCTSHAECNDGNPCTNDVCTSTGTCTNANTPSGTACPDDGNSCTRDVCNGSGLCTHPNLVAGTACGSAVDTDCTAPDTCNGSGVCLSNHDPSGTVCTDDGNSCTRDVCNGSGSCTHPNLVAGTACGSAVDSDCTAPDTCNGSGVCLSNHDPSGTVCTDDGNTCTRDICNGSGTCTHPNLTVGTPCGNSANTDCTAPDTCNGLGVCLSNHDPSGTVCTDDGNTCTRDVCNGTGLCTHPSLSNGTACTDDGNLCTTDMCSAGVCQHAPIVCNSTGNFCDGGSACNPATGRCESASSPCGAGYLCCEASNTCAVECCSDADCPDDGLFCNGQDRCVNGLCNSTAGPCQTGETCNEATDMCTSSCEPAGSTCSQNSDCCSGKCLGRGVCWAPRSAR